MYCLAHHKTKAPQSQLVQHWDKLHPPWYPAHLELKSCRITSLGVGKAARANLSHPGRRWETVKCMSQGCRSYIQSPAFSLLGSISEPLQDGGTGLDPSSSLVTAHCIVLQEPTVLEADPPWMAPAACDCSHAPPPPRAGGVK